MARKFSQNARKADEVRITPHLDNYLPEGSSIVTLSAATSESLDDLSHTLHADVEALIITILSDGETVFVRFDGSAATVNSFPLAAGGTYKISGNKGALSALRFYCTAGGDAYLLQQILEQK